MVKRKPRLIPFNENPNSAKGSSGGSLFGKPQLLPGEDPAVYNALLARVKADVKPADVIQEMLCNELVEEQWVVSRFRGIQVGMMRACQLRALTAFLREKLPLSQEEYVNELTKRLQDSIAESQEQTNARKLARQCWNGEPTARDAVQRILSSDDDEWDNEQFIADVRAEKAESLVQKYARGAPDAIRRINGILADEGVTLQSITALELTENIEAHVKLDQLTTMAVGRRNANLREIDHRREMLGETRASGIQKIQQSEVELIEATPFKEKKAS